MSKIYIYFHICTIGVWETIVRNTFSRLLRSGLLEKCDELRVCILGEHLETVRDILATDKLRIIFHSDDISLYERPCLEQLRIDSEKETFKVLYLHSKGVRDKNDSHRANINQWVEMMLYYLVDNHQMCIDILDVDSTAGTNFIKAGPAMNVTRGKGWHYSGNFWWANSDYICQLPTKIGPAYLDPEMWVGLGKGVMHQLHSSHCNHYYKPYPTNKYIGKFSHIKKNHNI